MQGEEERGEKRGERSTVVSLIGQFFLSLSLMPDLPRRYSPQPLTIYDSKEDLQSRHLDLDGLAGGIVNSKGNRTTVGSARRPDPAMPRLFVALIT